MPFSPPSWVPKLEQEIPDSVSVPDFMFDERYGRFSLEKARAPFVCGLSGKAPSALAVKEQVDLLARGLSRELGWRAIEGTQSDKVACIFSTNTIDFLSLSWAVHRLDGIITPANAQFSSSDLAYQLKDSGAKCLFTCRPLLQTALKAAEDVDLPRERVYLLELPETFAKTAGSAEFKNTNQLMELGRHSSEVGTLNWNKGDGKKKVAFICYSSGTSGLPKGVLIAHYNVIANTIQVCKFEQVSRSRLEVGRPYQENVLGLLPLSHIYGLIVIAHCSVWRGDSVIILPKFEFKQCLEAIQDYKINTLFLVPPIIILMTKNQRIISQYDLSSVRAIFTGAATLGQETAEALGRMFPTWLIRQAFGLTETCTVVSASSDFDIWFGSSGSLITGVEARLVTVEGKEITGNDQTGELWVKSPSLVIGYLNNEKANKETFVVDKNGDRWMRTGDEIVIKKAPSGNDHIFVVDRIKELIKVKGFQVAPAELEAHLLTSSHVADCAVISVANEEYGEVPKAYVVKSSTVGHEKSDSMVKQEIIKHVEQHKSRHKWLVGGVEFIDVVPKSPSGKILRRLLRDRESAKRAATQAKL